MKGLREIVLIHDLRRQGLGIPAIARKVGCERKTVRKYLEQGLAVPNYGPRPLQGSFLDPYRDCLRERVRAFPDLSGRRLRRAPLAVRFETPPGKQAQVDFTDEPGVVRKVWLFKLVPGHSRWLWGRFVSSQNLQTVMRCHIAAFDAMGGAREEILCDRMKTAVIGEDKTGIVTYNTSLVSLLKHYGSAPKACKPYRAQTKGKLERPFGYIRQDFFLARTLRNIDDLNARFDEWRCEIANPRVHASTERIVGEEKNRHSNRCQPSPTARC